MQHGKKRSSGLVARERQNMCKPIKPWIKQALVELIVTLELLFVYEDVLIGNMPLPLLLFAAGSHFQGMRQSIPSTSLRAFDPKL